MKILIGRKIVIRVLSFILLIENRDVSLPENNADKVIQNINTIISIKISNVIFAKI